MPQATIRPNVIHVHQHRVQGRAADVVVVQVDSVGARLGHNRGEVRRLAVVDRHVEAEAVLDHGRLVRRADQSDDPAAAQARDLPGHAADAAGGRADHDGLAGLDAADVVQSHVRRRARAAERPDVVGERHPVLGREGSSSRVSSVTMT
jgi:hypothetical protein